MRNFEVGSTQCMGGTKETMALYHRLAMDMGIPDSILLMVYCHTLDKKYPSTQNSIMRCLAVSKRNVESSIAKLRRDGYVSLEQTPAARNNRKIAITKKGIDFCRLHILPVVGALEAAYIRLSDEGRKIYLTSGIRGHSILHKEIQSIMSTRERRELR